MNGDVVNRARLEEEIDRIGKNSVGKTGFGAAVGVLSVCVLTAIILGSVSLNESNSGATQNINKITANFDTGDPTSTGVCVNLVGSKYQVSLDYSNTATTSYIQFLDGVTAGVAQQNRVLTLDANMGVSGISTLSSKVLYGQLGDGSGSGACPAYIKGLSVTNGSYLDGILISGDTTTNSVTGTNSAVVGGNDNIINAIDSDNCGIFAGNNNAISGQIQGRSVVLGGQLNNIIGDASYHSVIAGGQGSSIAGTESRNSGIIGGYQNKIEGTRSYQSFIAGGSENTISGTISNDSGIIGGQINKINSQFTFIGGGQGLSTQTGSSWNNSALVGMYNNHTTYPWDESGTQTHPGSCYRFIVGSGSASAVNNAFVVDDVGNLYFGTSAGASIYQRTGQNEYTPKAFTIQHPTINNRWLRHGCLEGPEGGVYYRGKGEAPTTIQLPNYATHIASDFTVQVTPIGSPRMMSASEVSPEGTFRVYGEGKFHWNAIGERVALDPEPLKTDVTIHSVGPYSWSV